MENNKNKIYTAALLVIGNEILSGRTKDENINYDNFAINDDFKNYKN